MTDDEYDAAMEELAAHVPNHPFLKKVRAPVSTSTSVTMPYYLGSLNKAKVADDLTKWSSRQPGDYHISEKLDGISGLWNPKAKKLYVSGEDMTGLDVSAWLPHMSLGPSGLKGVTDTWIRGELIMSKSAIPAGRLGRSIVNGIFHHKVPNPTEAAKVRFVAYEILGGEMTTTEQFAALGGLGAWLPWQTTARTLSPTDLTTALSNRRAEGEYDIDGLVIRTVKPAPRVTKGNPTDAIAWKPPNGESKLAKVVAVEWNASSTGKLIPRVEIEPVHLGGSQIKHVSGVNARRIVDWQIGPGAIVILRKGGDVIPVIDGVDTVAPVLALPPEGTWVWDGDANIKQCAADTTTIVAQYMKMVARLGWSDIGPAQMKAVVDAGYTTVPLLRRASEADLKKLVGPVKGAHLYKTVQDGWASASEIDLFVASPVCPSGIGKTRLGALLAAEPDVRKWTGAFLAPKGWSKEALTEFQGVWRKYEDLRKGDWSFLPYPVATPMATPVPGPMAMASPVPIPIPVGSIVFSGFRDAALEATLATRGYKVIDAVRSDTRIVLIADKEDPETYTSTKVEKAKKISGCRILRRSDVF